MTVWRAAYVEVGVIGRGSVRPETRPTGVLLAIKPV